MRRLPDQTDGAPGKSDVVSWLDAVQVLEEEAATRKHGLGVIYRFEQLPDRLGVCTPERPMPMDAVARPECPAAHPAATHRQPRLARGPRIAERCRRGIRIDRVKPHRQMIERRSQRMLPRR